MLGDGFYNGHTVGDVGNEYPVHNVDMVPVRITFVYHFYIALQVAEIGRQKGRCNFCLAHFVSVQKDLYKSSELCFYVLSHADKRMVFLPFWSVSLKVVFNFVYVLLFFVVLQPTRLKPVFGQRRYLGF